jgi:hypothetical protein
VRDDLTRAVAGVQRCQCSGNRRKWRREYTATLRQMNQTAFTIPYYHLSSVRTAPHRTFLVLKSPRRVNGGGNCDIKFVSTVGDTGSDGGRYILQIVKRRLDRCTRTALTWSGNRH